jgi:hypothetical protein
VSDKKKEREKILAKYKPQPGDSDKLTEPAPGHEPKNEKETKGK